MKEHIGDIRAARATGLIEGMAKGFDMKGERRKKQDDEQKEGSQENMVIAYGQKRNRRQERERQEDGMEREE